MGRRMVISDWQALLKLVKKGALITRRRRGVAFRVLARTQVDAGNRLQRLRLDRRDALGSTRGYPHWRRLEFTSVSVWVGEYSNRTPVKVMGDEVNALVLKVFRGAY